MKEIWKPITGYEGWYEVSNLGRVRSVERTVILEGKRDGQFRTYKSKILKNLISTSKYGGLSVHLHRHGRRETYSLGKLVAIHFLEGFCESKRRKVKYKDGDPSNCKLDNLTF